VYPSHPQLVPATLRFGRNILVECRATTTQLAPFDSAKRLSSSADELAETTRPGSLVIRGNACAIRRPTVMLVLFWTADETVDIPATIDATQSTVVHNIFSRKLRVMRRLPTQF
jgi:hypothetical protein